MIHRMKKKPKAFPAYDPANIENKWQKKWASSKIYKSQENSKKEKFYVLDMFPYPSGEGLHVGHPKGYIATDIVSRFERMNGKSVLHPMGFDAFGLPAENYALKTKTHPEIGVKKNVARYKKQLEILGFDYDWSREINTTDPEYYRWTQWIFVQLFKKGLAYESFEPINWCPSCKTGLANEDLEDGRCERCGTPVEKKPLRQWVLKITDYADRLLKDLDAKAPQTPLIEVTTGEFAWQPDKPVVPRSCMLAIVKHWAKDEYLCLSSEKHGWTTFVIGGIEQGEDAIKTAEREIAEETGFTNIKYVRTLGNPIYAKHFAPHKNVNRLAEVTGLYFELQSPTQQPVAAEESAHQKVVWVPAKEIEARLNPKITDWAFWQRLHGKEPVFSIPEQPLIDWPASIKESQRNWIGKSEGSLITFTFSNASHEKNIEVFTTRPDTLFGVTYVVLAPEHALVADLLPVVKNRQEVETYISQAKLETEIERTDAKKDKTGVELKGVKVINPVNKQEVPVWISDYVLADYGTGAVMAVPAHDDRDWAFAKKFKLPIKEVISSLFVSEYSSDAWRPQEPEVVRPTVVCIIKHWSENKYLFLNKKDLADLGKDVVVGVAGGVDGGEVHEVAGAREILEETGYKNARFVKSLGEPVAYRYYSKNGKQNRLAMLYPLYYELKDGEQVQVSEEEKSLHQTIWLTENEMDVYLNGRPFNPIFWERFKGTTRPYTGYGILINSGKFDGISSANAKRSITEYAGGAMKTTYKLRDWVFSRQRYWGEPMPLIHCEKCGVVTVPETDLPVKLPKVTSYEPTGTGESPLAAISKWVNVKCPQCKGKAKRETNTMPQWAGSSWYYLRYMDPKNKKVLVDPKNEKYWSPVDLYVGGAEHATRHLIYARFWHKFLYDIGVVSSIEPFKKLQSVGLIMGEDGRKMGKRYGNVVNPDDIVATYGADTLRLYEMFMGPFEQQIAWSTSSMVGSRRFIEKVWKLREKVGSAELSPEINTAITKVVHKTIKKVTEDIRALRFNTAISSLMIAINEIDVYESITRDQYELILRLLAPFAPHVSEELWTSLGNKKSVHISSWPTYDPAQAVDAEMTIVVQINGKVRGSFVVAINTSTADLEKMALNIPETGKWIEGKKVVKVIVVPKRLVNIVVV